MHATDELWISQRVHRVTGWYWYYIKYITICEVE